MIEYYETLLPEEQEDLIEVVKALYRQTFLLEQKFDRRLGRMVYQQDYRICSRHLEFLKRYFAISGIELKENAHMGLIYIQGENLMGEKLPKLATIYILILKLLYDEQMASASASSHIVTTLGAINGKAGDFGILRTMPSPTEMKRTISLLKKCQIVEPLDIIEELDEHMRLVIYPCINAVVSGDNVSELLNTFSEEEYSGKEPALQSNFENMSE